MFAINDRYCARGRCRSGALADSWMKGPRGIIGREVIIDELITLFDLDDSLALIL